MDSDELEALVSEGVDDSLTIETGEPSELDEPTGEPESTPEPEAKPEPEAGAKPGETGSESPTEPEPDDFDPDDPAEKTPEQRAGLRRSFKERQEKWRKREQELLEETARLRGRAEAFQQQGVPTQEPQPEVDGDAEFYEKGPAAYVDQKLQTMAQQQKVALSAQVMRSIHDDYDEHIGEFMEMVRDDPSLETRAANSDNPAKFAYDYAKIARETRDIGSPEEWKAKTRAELRAEVEAELREDKAKAAAAEATTSSASANGAGAASQVAAQSVEDWFDIDEVLKGVNNR